MPGTSTRKRLLEIQILVWAEDGIAVWHSLCRAVRIEPQLRRKLKEMERTFLAQCERFSRIFPRDYYVSMVKPEFRNCLCTFVSF